MGSPGETPDMVRQEEEKRRDGGGVSIVPVAENTDFDGMAKCMDGFSSKTCCFCIKDHHTGDSLRKQFLKYPKSKMELSGVATDEKTNEVLGFIRVCDYEHRALIFPFRGIHDMKPGEMYIEQLGVGAHARGKGVGTKLLEWAHARGRENGLTRSSLGVLRGNRAKKLYERVGYVVKPDEDCIEGCFNALCTLWLVGRPYGCFSQMGADTMVKTLEAGS